MVPISSSVLLVRHILSDSSATCTWCCSQVSSLAPCIKLTPADEPLYLYHRFCHIYNESRSKSVDLIAHIFSETHTSSTGPSQFCNVRPIAVRLVSWELMVRDCQVFSLYSNEQHAISTRSWSGYPSKRQKQQCSYGGFGSRSPGNRIPSLSILLQSSSQGFLSYTYRVRPFFQSFYEERLGSVVHSYLVWFIHYVSLTHN